MTYHIEQKSGWSYVVGEGGDLPARDSGPWRYKWEAEEYADELNARDAKFGGTTTVVLGECLPTARLDKQEG